MPVLKITWKIRLCVGCELAHHLNSPLFLSLGSVVTSVD